MLPPFPVGVEGFDLPKPFLFVVLIPFLVFSLIDHPHIDASNKKKKNCTGLGTKAGG